MSSPKSSPGPGRPKGHKNSGPTLKELDEYKRKLKESANRGDIKSMAWLLLIDSIKKTNEES